MRPAEARLLADWSSMTIAAYGAELRAAGDPRGELIAIDLVLEALPSHAVRKALTEEKRALHVAWLGEVAEHIRTRFGFVEELSGEPEIELQLFDKVVPYLRVFKLVGEYLHVRELVTRLAVAPRPWLVALEIRSFTDTRETAIDTALGARLIAATPNLAKLTLDGHFICDELPHPGITDLVLQGFDAIGALRGKGVMPNVQRLTVTLHPGQFIHREPPPQALREGWVPRASFPAVEVLDLSRNEPNQRTREPNCYAGETAFFDVLPRIAILPHVRELRVPSVRNEAQRAHLEAALERMPALRRLEIARVYGEESSPRARAGVEIVVAERSVWPAATALRDYDALLFHVGGRWQRAELAQAYEICETRYATMAPAAQRAWAELWQLVRALGTDDVRRVVRFSTEHLRCAADLADADQYAWDELATALDEHPDDHVEVRRLDGYEDEPEEPRAPRVAASGERIEEHERALQAHWDLERLAVYADELQQLGDARGELIAIDLRIEREGGDRDLGFEHDDLHEAVFGDAYEVKSKLGFTMIDVEWSSGHEDPLAKILVGDASRYLREIAIAGLMDAVERDLAHVLAEPRPWLRAVRVETMGEGEARIADWAHVHEAWPNLEVLDLGFDDRASVFVDFVHPRVTDLRITHLPALAQLGGPWPAVTTLDVAFGDTSLHDVPTHLLTHARFPALRMLDLSRNEPQVGRLGREHRFQGSAIVYDTFARLEPALLAQLAHVRVPSPRHAAAVHAFQATLDRMPALETFEIVRRYPRGPDITLHHARARIVIPAPSPWPPLDTIAADSSIEIAKIVIPLGKAIAAMEKSYASFVEPGRTAWAALWRTLENPAATLRAKAADIYAAMAELEERDAYVYEWAAKLVAALHSPALADETITIRR